MMTFKEDEVIIFRTLIGYLQYMSLFPRNGGSFDLRLFMKYVTPLMIFGTPFVVGILGHLHQAYLILLYGAESWTLTDASMKKLTAFEIWLRISWVDHITNEEVLHRMNESMEIVMTVKSRKLGYLPGSDKNFDAMVYSAYYLNFAIMCHSVTILNFIKGNKKLIPFLKIASQVNDEFRREYKEEIEKINKFTRIFFYASCTITLCVTLDSYGKDNMFCNDERIINDQHYICGLVTTLWFPIEITKKMKPLFALCNAAVCFYYLPMMASSVSYYLVCRLVVVRIEHVIKLLKQLEFQEELVEKTQSKMHLCVKNYIEITRMVRKMNETIGIILAPSHNAVDNVLVGTCGYLMLKFHSPAYALQLLMWILVQWIACYCGQQLEDANLKLQCELYNVPWYNICPSLRSSFKMFQAQISLPLHLKIRPIHFLNMNHFSELIQGTYTFLMFLLRI